MIMALRFYRSIVPIEKQAIETSDKPAPSTSKSKKTLENRQRIMEYLKDHGRSKCADIAGFLGLSAERTRAILSEMPEVESMGSNRHRTYRIR